MRAASAEPCRRSRARSSSRRCPGPPASPSHSRQTCPFAIAYSTAFPSLTSVFALTVVVAPALLRDTEHQVAEIVYATSVAKWIWAAGLPARSSPPDPPPFSAPWAWMAGLLRHEPGRIAPFEPGRQ